MRNQIVTTRALAGRINGNSKTVREALGKARGESNKAEFGIITLYQTAIHEAGHVVVGYALGLHSNEAALTHDEAQETGSYGHVTGPNPWLGYSHHSERERQATMRDECIACCAGLAAEHVFFEAPLNTDNEYAQFDFQNIIECERNGLRIRRKFNGFVGDDATWGYISRLLKEARKLVKRHRHEIQRFAETLIERKKLKGEEIERLLKEWMPGVRSEW